LSDGVVIPKVPDSELDARQRIDSNILALRNEFSEERGHLVADDKNPLAGRASHPSDQMHPDLSEHFLRITSVIGLVSWFLAAILLSLIRPDVNPFFIFLGLSPIIFTIMVTYILVDNYHMESGFLMVFPFIFTGIFLVLGAGGLLGDIDFLTLATVNIVCGLLFEAVLVLQHSFMAHEHRKSHSVERTVSSEHPVEEIHEKSIHEIPTHRVEIVDMTRPETETAEAPKIMRIALNDENDVRKFVASIEDKVKAINAVIGRVYSVKHGGSESLRKKIRVDPEHYNGFNELKDQYALKRKVAALKILKKIRTTLLILNRHERAVFDSVDIDSLVNLDRDAHGKDIIMDVLAKNDSDPVKSYYEGALQFCEDAIKSLGSETAESVASPPRKKLRLSTTAKKRILKSIKKKK
jgi:hypothetical protein